MPDPTPRRPPIYLHHEKLDCYRASIEFLSLAHDIATKLPRGFGPLADQLRRAAISIPLNIAEGYGKRTSAEKAKFYDIARGSAHECAAVLDAASALGQLNAEEMQRGKDLLRRTVAMLVRLCEQMREPR